MVWFAGRSENFRKELSAACPDGIDICAPQLSFRLSASMSSDSLLDCLLTGSLSLLLVVVADFDNTGGMILQTALFNMATKGRIVCCGNVSQYDTATPEPGPRGAPQFLP